MNSPDASTPTPGAQSTNWPLSAGNTQQKALEHLLRALSATGSPTYELRVDTHGGITVIVKPTLPLGSLFPR